MFSLAEARPSNGTWVFWVAVEQCNGHISSGLSKWREKDYDNLTQDGLVSFWAKANEIAEAQLKGRLVELEQQLDENVEQNENLTALYDITQESINELGA